MTPAASRKKHEGRPRQTGTRRGRAREPATRNQESPGTGRPGHQDGKRFAFFGSAGSWVGALCTVLGTAPEGSAAEPSRAALLNPPPCRGALLFCFGKREPRALPPPSLRVAHAFRRRPTQRDNFSRSALSTYDQSRRCRFIWHTLIKRFDNTK